MIMWTAVLVSQPDIVIDLEHKIRCDLNYDAQSTINI